MRFYFYRNSILLLSHSRKWNKIQIKILKFLKKDIILILMFVLRKDQISIFIEDLVIQKLVMFSNFNYSLNIFENFIYLDYKMDNSKQ